MTLGSSGHQGPEMCAWSRQHSQGVRDRREVKQEKGGKGLGTCWRGLSRAVEGDRSQGPLKQIMSWSGFCGGTRHHGSHVGRRVEETQCKEEGGGSGQDMMRT